MLLIENKGFPDNHPFSRVRAMPSDVALPPLFLLGSSDYSAKLAASIGAGFSFAHHFASHDAADAMQTYRANFRPSALLAKPYAILAVAAVCADSESEAERIAATADLNIVRRAKGDYLPLESPDAALAFPYTPIDRDRIAQNRERLFVGTPDNVKARLTSLATATAADEIMVTGMIYDHARAQDILRAAGESVRSHSVVLRGGVRRVPIQLSNSQVLKRASVFVLASGNPARASDLFSISLPRERFACSLQKREQSAVWRRESVPLQGARDRSCRTGLALRRSTAAFSSPWGPTSLAQRRRLSPPAGKVQGTLTLGVIMGREAAIQGLPGPRSAKPWAQAPLPIHIWLRLGRAPLCGWGCAQSSR